MGSDSEAGEKTDTTATMALRAVEYARAALAPGIEQAFTSHGSFPAFHGRHVR